MVGDMGRYTQFEVAQSIPVAAANEGGGGAGLGAGLGAGVAMGQAMVDAIKQARSSGGGEPANTGSAPAGAAPAADTKFCLNCGKPIPKVSKFCPECGHAQQ
jgi:membrane protease subunit (stomatin/prohibitin family)